MYRKFIDGLGAFALAVSAIALAPQAYAEVQKIEIAHLDSVQSGKSFGAGGAYEKIVGRVYFAIDPAKSENQKIADLSLAPRNSAGLVEFSADFAMLRPVEGARARRSVLLEIPNRGGTQENGWLFSTASGSRFMLPELKDLTFDDAFGLEQGFTLAWIGWQFDVPAGGMGIRVPSAPVHGAVRAALIPTVQEVGTKVYSLRQPSFYCAADARQPDAVLTVRAHFDAAGETLPRSAWSFAREEGGNRIPDPCSLFLESGFERGKLYQFVYQGSEPPIAGLGLAAVRDFVSFLKHGIESDEGGRVLRKNPIAHVLGFGYSQSGRFLREFLYRGFNADERGRRAFDGLFIASAGAGRGSFDHRYAMPGEAGNSVLSVLRPVDLFPFSDESETDPVQPSSGSLLAAAEESSAVPRILYTYSSTEFWARVGSLALTSVDGTKELPLNAKARLYFIAGTPHSRAPFPPIKQRKNPTASYAYFANFATAGWSFRALLLDLDDWVSKDVQPPASVYPQLPRDLVPREKVNFPKIPGADFPLYVPNDWRMDYGPHFRDTGVITREPPKLGVPYRILLPQVDNDGNDVGGIRLPEVAVPLGTFTGWNYEVPSLPDFQYLGGLVGSFVPFAKSRKEREATGDSRLSIEERYSTRDEYLRRVRIAASELIGRRLLRAEDLEAIVQRSAEQWDYLTSSVPEHGKQ
jgi:hypothetical protein